MIEGTDGIDGRHVGTSGRQHGRMQPGEHAGREAEPESSSWRHDVLPRLLSKRNYALGALRLSQAMPRNQKAAAFVSLFPHRPAHENIKKSLPQQRGPFVEGGGRNNVKYGLKRLLGP